MLGNRNLVVDTMSEVYEELLPYATATFVHYGDHEPVPDSVYVLGRQQVVENVDKFKRMAEDPAYTMVFGNSAEGSSTLIAQLRVLGLEELVLNNKILLISGGDIEAPYPYMLHEHFLIRILDYDENIDEMKRTEEIFSKTDKPYKFLFLNGRARPHRKYLWEHFKRRGLLEESLWTMLDSRPTVVRNFNFYEGEVNVMATNTPLQSLPTQYEVNRYCNDQRDPKEWSWAGPPSRTFIKNDLFDNQWGEIYLNADPYIDTYFSVVTETVYDYPYSFRTEKIAKPLAMGHPWICAASRGWYRDIQNIGFRTFNVVIDESFDQIDNDQDRMDRIITVVDDLCQQDLASFLKECYTICKYNQQHLAEISAKVRKEFPERFSQFIKKYQ
jgi:hypothetical protein